MKPYNAKFAVGETVRIAEAPQLEEFRRTWRHHNPLNAEQLAFAGKVTRVAEVGFYHGGDPLYVLEHTPGVWHEVCIARADEAG